MRALASTSMTKMMNALVGGRKGPWAFISANRPEYTPEQRKQKTQELRQTLRNLGLQPQEASGGYMGDPEPSFFIYGLSKDMATWIGNEFQQDSVLVGQGGNYQFIETTTDQQGNVWPRESPKMDAKKNLHVLTPQENTQIDNQLAVPPDRRGEWQVPGYTRLDSPNTPRYPDGNKKRITLDPQFAPENRPKVSNWIKNNCKFAQK